ncbi:MAG: epoxyqueuosine reductase [Desulfobulbaceae bacterium]
MTAVTGTAVQEAVSRFLAESPVNSLFPETREPIFASPLVGFSAGDDPLYVEFRRHIGSFYYTPADMFRDEFPDGSVSGGLTVISWVLPSTRRTREEQAARRKHPSERWARTRALGEECNNALRRHLVSWLRERGVRAFAPLLSPHWSRSDEGPYAPCSNWSERHAAYAAGLGTFGLCDGLITPVGKAVRVGSVIAECALPPTPRPYTDHHAYCLHFTAGTCRECVARCPVGALSAAGHDKQRCMRYTEGSMNQYIRKKFGLDTYACGLCQAGVACTYGIPAATPDSAGRKEDG